VKSLFIENVLDSATRVFQGTTGHLFLLKYLSKGPVDQQPLSDNNVKSFKSQSEASISMNLKSTPSEKLRK